MAKRKSRKTAKRIAKKAAAHKSGKTKAAARKAPAKKRAAKAKATPKPKAASKPIVPARRKTNTRRQSAVPRPVPHKQSGGGIYDRDLARNAANHRPLTPLGFLERAASSSSSNSHNSQLVDLVVEDREAANIERVRARKEGGPGWNSVEQKHFVKVYPKDEEAEEVRQGFNPDQPEMGIQDDNHDLVEPADAREGVSEVAGRDQTGARQPWEERVYDEPFEDEREVWGGRE